MARQRLSLEFVAVCSGIVGPNLKVVIRPTRDESPVASRSGARGRRDNGSWGSGGGPGYAVHAETVSMEDGVFPAVVAEFENGNVAV